MIESIWTQSSKCFLPGPSVETFTDLWFRKHCTAVLYTLLTTSYVTTIPNTLTLVQGSPTVLARGTGFMANNFPMDQGWGGSLQGDTSALHLSCTFFLLSLHQLHLRSRGIRSQRLGTPTLVSLLMFQTHCHARDPSKHKIHSQICILTMNYHIQTVTLTAHLSPMTHTGSLRLAPQAYCWHGSLPSTHSMLHSISCLQYFFHNLCLSLHEFLSLHTMFRLHLLLGIPSPSCCLPNSSLSQDSAGTSLPSESPPGCLSGTTDTFLLLSLPPCMHLIYTWPRHSAQCPTHIVKSKTKCTQMKCY